MSTASLDTAPTEKLAESGVKMMSAELKEVGMRTVMCTDGGATLKFDGGAGAEKDYSHTKTSMLSFTVIEKRKNPDPGEGANFDEFPMKLQAKNLSRVTALSVQVNGQVFDLLTHNMQLVLAKNVASMPTKAMLSLQYSSPLGGTRFVEDHPIQLDFVDPKAACCTIM